MATECVCDGCDVWGGRLLIYVWGFSCGGVGVQYDLVGGLYEV